MASTNMAGEDGDHLAATDQTSDNQTVAAQNSTEPQNGQVAEGEQQQQQARPNGWSMFKTMAIRMVIIYMISSWLRRPSTPTPTQGPGEGQVSTNAMQPAMNMFAKETVLDMYLYIGENEKFGEFEDPKALVWLEEELVYGDWTSGVNKDGSYEKFHQITVSENVKNNGSLYLHVYFVKAGNSPNPKDRDIYDKKFMIHRTKRLTKYKKRKFHTTTNLLTGTTDAHPDLIRKTNDTPFEILNFWHPNLTINLVDDQTPWVKGAIPAPLDDYIEFDPITGQYYPIVYFNDYWNLNSDYMPINDSTPVLNLSLTYSPMTLFKWQMYAAQSMRNKWYSFMGDDFMEESDEDQDSLKTTFLETNPYLLALTIVVSLVHSVFEFLAFKNDIQFWRNRKSLEGLSVRSVFFNVFQSLIVLLYVLDNETNFVVKCSVFVGLGIEIWKIHKVVDVKIDRENKIMGLIPRVSLCDKSTYTQSETKHYDKMAFKYLSWLLFPLILAYGIYSVFYLEHRGWYSWVLSLMYGFLLTFGFIMMTPQLFINYKMKSVAHLPWRMLTYKALNTFIDDLFAFVIKMPTLYRIGCFRDDIVFLIYIYQRYIYKIDPKRMNEFGVSADMLDENGQVVPETDEANGQIENNQPKPIEEKKTD